MKVLVTGGAGFIGSHVVDRLVEEGHDVVVVDNLSTGKRKNVNRAANLYKLDIQNSRLERVFRNERPNVVIHLAAQVSVRNSVADPVYDAQVNILGTMNVVHQAVQHGAHGGLLAAPACDDVGLGDDAVADHPVGVLEEQLHHRHLALGDGHPVPPDAQEAVLVEVGLEGRLGVDGGCGGGVHVCVDSLGCWIR